MQLDVSTYVVHTRVPFRIARGESSAFTLVGVTLTARDGVTGRGEAAPSAFFGESVETVHRALEGCRPWLSTIDGWSLEAIDAELVTHCPDAAARSALDAALHDLMARRQQRPLHDVWGCTPAQAPRSSFTIGIAPDLATLRARVADAVQAGYPILKVKLGTSDDRAILAAVREVAPEVILRVDANAGWSVPQALAMLDPLAALGVESLEQPVAVPDVEGLGTLRAAGVLPIIADEACRTAADIPRLAEHVDGINIKLGKCGGPSEALRMIAAARARGLRVMCGCRIESSLGITPAAHLAGALDDADLDGAALLADDPWQGATIARGVIALPSGAGHGVTPRRETRALAE